MRYIKANDENVKQALGVALLGGEWIICATAENPDNSLNYVFENVTRYESKGHFASLMKNPVFIEYGISLAPNEAQYPYRIHDSLMTPVIAGNMFNRLLNSMIEMFDVFILEGGMVDRVNVYGKLSTMHAEEIVFVNQGDK